MKLLTSQEDFFEYTNEIDNGHDEIINHVNQPFEFPCLVDTTFDSGGKVFEDIDAVHTFHTKEDIQKLLDLFNTRENSLKQD